MTSRLFLFLSLCCLFNAPAPADLADARAATARGDYTAAAREYRRLAEAGDAVAQAHLGYLYYQGEGVEQDYASAVKWYRESALQGNVDAQYNLAVAYAFGEGVQQDYGKAVEWYRRAADQGHAAAQYSLGLSYANGEGVERDLDQAQRWFRQAADQGYAAAGEALKAVERARSSASTPDRRAPADAGSTILAMESIEPALPEPRAPGADLLASRNDPQATDAEQPAAEDTPEQAGTQETKQGFLKRLFGEDAGADSGGDAASVTAAAADTAGGAAARDTAGDTTESTADGATATAGVDEEKQSFLSRLFGSDSDQDETQAGATEKAAIESSTGPAVPESVETAETETAGTGDSAERQQKQGFFGGLFSGGKKKSTAGKETGDAPAHRFDPELYQQGITALENGDYGSAVEALRKGAGQGDPRAQHRLGSLYYRGLGVSRDHAEAARWYRRAAEAGHAEAQYALGNMYFMGEGVDQDDSRAAYWYQQAADQGHASARDNLSTLKRVLKSAGEPLEIIEGEKPAQEEAGPEEAGTEKRGFFQRLFKREEKQQNASRDTDTAAAVETAQAEPLPEPEPEQTHAQEEDNKEDKGRLSFLHKDEGGLFGYLFGDDDEDEAEQALPDSTAATEATAGQVGPEADTGNAEAAAESEDQDQGRLAFLHKDEGGLFGYLFGDDDEDEAGQQTPPQAEPQQAGPETESEPVAQQAGSASVPESAIEDYRRGLAYSLGDSVEADPAEALRLFQRSAEQGYAPAQYQLGVAYAYGRGTPRDKQEAARWYRQAAAQGHNIAQRNLGMMYSSGDGVEQDRVRALAWYSILAERGNVMDIQRRDSLVRELSPEQIEQAYLLKGRLQQDTTTTHN